MARTPCTRRSSGQDATYLSPQQSLWASVLPEVARGLPPALAELDTYLEDPALFEPFKAHFSLTEGRPSVPMETYVRLLVLKYRYRLGYETLCAEVSDSVSWRLFCKVPVGAPCPTPRRWRRSPAVAARRPSRR